MRADFVLAGAMLGLTHYFYEGGRLLYTPLIILWLLSVLVIRWRNGVQLSRPLTQNITVFLLTALIIAAPVYYTLRATDATLTPRLDVTRREAAPAISDTVDYVMTEQISRAFRAYVQIPDGSWFYSGDTALMLPYLVPIFLLGMAHVLWRLQSPGGSMLILWICVTSLGNSLLIDANHSPRFVVAFPAIALVLAVGVRYTLPLLWPVTSQVRTIFGLSLRRAVVVMVITVLALSQVSYYFGTHLGRFNSQFLLKKDLDDAMFRMVELPLQTDVYYISSSIIWNYNVLGTAYFWYRDEDLWVQTYFPQDFANIVDELPLNRNYAFFVEAEDSATLDLLRERFGDIGAPQYSPHDVPLEHQYVMYYVRK